MVNQKLSGNPLVVLELQRSRRQAFVEVGTTPAAESFVRA